MSIFTSSTSARINDSVQRRRIISPKPRSPPYSQNVTQTNFSPTLPMINSSTTTTGLVLPSFIGSASSSSVTNPLPYSGNYVSTIPSPSSFPTFVTSGSSNMNSSYYARPLTPPRDIFAATEQKVSSVESTRPLTPPRDIFARTTNTMRSTPAETARPLTPPRDIFANMTLTNTMRSTPVESARPLTPPRDIFAGTTNTMNTASMMNTTRFTSPEVSRPLTPPRDIFANMASSSTMMETKSIPNHIIIPQQNSMFPMTARETMENSTSTRSIITPMAYSPKTASPTNGKRVIIIPKVRSCAQDNLGSTQYYSKSNETNHGSNLRRPERRIVTPMVSQETSVRPRRVVIIPKPRPASPSSMNSGTRQMNYPSYRM